MFFDDLLAIEQEAQLVRRIADRIFASLEEKTAARHQSLILAGKKALSSAPSAFRESGARGQISYRRFRKEWIHSAMFEAMYRFDDRVRLVA